MAPDTQVAKPPTPFLTLLTRQLRAQETNGGWDKKPDAELLAPFILDRAQRRALPVSGDPDPDVLWRVELFHEAVAQAIEARTGVPCTPIMKMHHEGFGRLVLVGGRLVVVNRFLRDIHRFGFDSPEALANAGEELVSRGAEMIAAFPDAARWGA
jgi:probable nitrogen fixation protein